jgi:putative tricarboxylic transport membrane protein
MPARGFGGVVLVFGAVLFYLSLQLPLHTLNGPGAGFFPVLIAVGLVITGVSVALQPKLIVPEGLAPGSTHKVLIVFASLIAFCLLLPRIGYIPSGVAVMVAVLKQFDISWALALSVALAGSVATYLLFVSLLGLPLPRGSWLGI